MTHFRFPAAVVVGSLLAATAAYAASPYAASSPQERAENACLKHRVQPNSTVWELCLSHVTRAYEWDEPALAQQLANAAGHASDSCRDQGYDAETSGYRACVNREMDARSYLNVLGDDNSSNAENVARAQ
ncbi:hypothetical protein [Enhydrobacter sp.]|uniref:hypothetical protein n=1 Tax=Enhydrobacter sp. TaxID=1894999 RepID=UPI0026357265|nr:hypothetical protein [Enhydrobacter sp.]WIM09994.1 MAG: hypothetical protein OJF58_000947 [Enhydrobacter sp.]